MGIPLAPNMLATFFSRHQCHHPFRHHSLNLNTKLICIAVCQKLRQKILWFLFWEWVNLNTLPQLPTGLVAKAFVAYFETSDFVCVRRTKMFLNKFAVLKILQLLRHLASYAVLPMACYSLFPSVTLVFLLLLL